MRARVNVENIPYKHDCKYIHEFKRKKRLEQLSAGKRPI